MSRILNTVKLLELYQLSYNRLLRAKDKIRTCDHLGTNQFEVTVNNCIDIDYGASEDFHLFRIGLTITSHI